MKTLPIAAHSQEIGMGMSMEMHDHEQPSK
jgi:hypothetical protein